MTSVTNSNEKSNVSVKSDGYISEIESVSSIEITERSTPSHQSNVSTVRLDEDSDSDAEIVINHNSNDYMKPPIEIKLGNENNDLSQFDHAKPTFGNVTIQNSAHPMFGNKTFYKGQITINHFVYDTDKWKRNESHKNVNAKYVESDVDYRKENDATVSENHHEKHNLQKWKHVNIKTIMIALAIGSLIISLTVFLIIMAVHYHNNQNDESSISEPLRIISRDEWGAIPSLNESQPLELPSIRVIIAHTVTDSCTVKAACKETVRKIQKLHMKTFEWDDIGYHFLVGGDGAVYVGRGWDIEGAHTLGYNKRSICIAFIGTFTDEVPPKRQLDASQNIIQNGLELKKIRADYNLYGQRQLIETESLGKLLYEIIKKWEHWNEVYE